MIRQRMAFGFDPASDQKKKSAGYIGQPILASPHWSERHEKTV
jgi:hypothetical protein